MSNARDKANIPALNFSSTGIDDNATSTAITIDSSERVGVGTTSPDHLIHISANSSNAQLKLQRTGSATASFNISASSDSLAFSDQAASTERMRITSTGLGIGTSSPVKKLVASNGGAEGIELSPGDSSNVNMVLNYNRSTSAYIASQQRASYHRFDTPTTEAMRLTSTGLGIGTTSPSAKLHVADNIKGDGNFSLGTLPSGASSSSYRQAQIANSFISDSGGTNSSFQLLQNAYVGSGNNNYATVGSGASHANRLMMTSGVMSFSRAYPVTADSQITFSESMRIDSSGNVGIGTSSPDEKFHVVDTGSSQATKIHSDTNNSGVLGMSVLAGLDTPSSSGDCKWIRLADGNDSGKAYIQFKSSSPNAEFVAISDERLKTNIQDTDVVGLDVINNLRLVKFDWDETATQNAGWSMTGHQKLGFVAQEVEQVLPEFISEDTSGFKIMGDSGFVPYLIKAVQEQQTKIQELEARITALETNQP